MSLLKVKVTLAQLVSGLQRMVGGAWWAWLKHSPWPVQGSVKHCSLLMGTQIWPSGHSEITVLLWRLQVFGPHQNWRTQKIQWQHYWWWTQHCMNCHQWEKISHWTKCSSYLCARNSPVVTPAAITAFVPPTSVSKDPSSDRTAPPCSWEESKIQYITKLAADIDHQVVVVDQ